MCTVRAQSSGKALGLEWTSSPDRLNQSQQNQNQPERDPPRDPRGSEGGLRKAVSVGPFRCPFYLFLFPVSHSTKVKRRSNIHGVVFPVVPSLAFSCSAYGLLAFRVSFVLVCFWRFRIFSDVSGVLPHGVVHAATVRITRTVVALLLILILILILIFRWRVGVFSSSVGVFSGFRSGFTVIRVNVNIEKKLLSRCHLSQLA